MATLSDPGPLRVELERPDRIYAQGETVRATISLSPSSELVIRTLRVVFMYTERYQLRQLSNEGGDYFATDTDEKILGERLLVENGHFSAGQSQTWNFEANIPANARPSHPGQLFQIEYAVRADADREHGVDFHAEGHAIVISPCPQEDDRNPESEEDEAEKDFVNTTELKEGVFTFQFDHEGYCEGDVVAGTLIAVAKRDLDIKGLRLELAHQEALLEGLSNMVTDVMATSNPSGPTRLRAGVRTEFPFRFELPILNRPSVETERAWSATIVVATFDRRLARDLEVTGHLAVYSARR